MSDRHEVIELLTSSDEASSSDSERRSPPRRAQSHSSSEEEKEQLKPKKRRLVRPSLSVRVSSSRGKRSISSESESNQESEDSEDIMDRLAQLKRSRHAPAPKKAKVAVTKTRRDPSADGEMRQITEGMSFYELQAQEQMMAKYQAQNRRKAPRVESSPKKTTVARVSSKISCELKDKMSVSDMQAQKRALEQHHRQTARKSAPMQAKYDSESGSEGSEDSEEEWGEFTKKSAQRAALRRQQNAASDVRPMERNLEMTHKSTASRTNGASHKTGKQTARKMALTKSSEQRKTVKRTLVINSRTTKQRVVERKSRSSSSESESGEESDQGIEQENKEKNGESSGDEIELIAQPTSQRQEKTISHKKTSQSSQPVIETDAQAVLRAVLHGTSETQHLKEKMSYRELQEQEKLMAFFRAQKRRNASGASSTGRKGSQNEHSTNDTNGAAKKTNSSTMTNGAIKTNGSGRRARMGFNQKETPDTSTTLYVATPSRSGFLASNAPFVSSAGCTATPEEKPSNPVIHSTAWRRLIFEEAPPNILDDVSASPYSSGSDRPLWDYDRKGELKEKCKFVDAVGQGVAITEDNFEIQPPSQSEVNRQVRQLVEQELPYIKKCHARRVRHILKGTRKQLSEYLQAHQVLRSERYRRLQWSEIANHQSWLDVSPIERVTAKRTLQSPTHTVRPYNYLVGDVRYYVHRDQTPLQSLVYPETVTHLPNDITAVRRSFTMIGIRKNAFVEDDPILRYVPYLGDGEKLVVDNDLYTETTMSKERRIAVLGEGEDLKVLNPGARDDEIMEYLLRVIVGKCGSSEQVFLALQHEAGFDRPRIDYCDMKDTYKAEQCTANRIAKVRELIAVQPDLSTNGIPVTQMNACKSVRELAQPYWFLRDTPEPQSLAVRLQPPLSVFESNYVHAPEALGIRDRKTFEGLVEWHRDLFCRRCFTYDCYEHGIQNPRRSLRADPVYPMVTAPCIVLARQEVPVKESNASTEDGSSNPSIQAEIIELTSSSSSSEDEAQESKSQQTPVAQLEPQSSIGYRRSIRAQTRISSLATKSLETQEKMLESERLAELEKRRKRREKFARAADNSEYLDNSYLPAVTTTLKKLLSKTQPCGPSCWLTAGDKEFDQGYQEMRQVDSVLVRKLASSFGPNACVISAVLKSPKCTCTQISRFLAEEKRRRESGDDLGNENDLSMPAETRRKGRRHSSGVGSNRSLAKRVREQRSYDREKKLSYKPCNHDGVCDETCDCTKRGHSCNRACSCPRDCPNRFQGCKCSMGNCHSSACPCWTAGRECDPDYCFTCGASDAAVMAFHPEFKSWSSYNLNICQNMNMLRGSIQKKVGVAFSATHGWGAYALEPIRKDEFVLEYTGELITDEEAERRGAIYDRKAVSYLFGVNSEYVVDAARKGNKAKFANHKANGVANLDVKIIASNGEHRIGLFANEAIEVGAELFFDYGYTHDSAPKWSQHGKPQPEKRVYDIVDDENEWEQWE